jgi:EmrB/QacA subfamily drug resistance transporter
MIDNAPHSEGQGSHHGWALAVLLIGAILPPLDYFIVNLALPAIRDGIGASESHLQLVVSAYACAYAVVLTTGGRLGDLYGRKRIFMIGMAGFVLASVLCGVAGNGNILVAGRTLQGLFAAILAPQVLSTIRSVFTAREQVRVMGFYGFVFGLSAVIGQLGGGALISLHPFGLGWRSIFLVNLPIGVFALLGAWRYLPENKSPRSARIDVAGMVLLSLFLGLLIYPLTRGREEGWPAWTLLSLAASVPALIVLLVVEKREIASGREPLLDLRLFNNPIIGGGLALAFLLYFGLSTFFLIYGIYLQGSLGWTPLQSGMAILPFGLGFLASPLFSPWLVQRLGGFRVLSLGFALLGGGLVLTALPPLPDLLFYLGLAAMGVGQGLTLPSVLRIVMGAAESHQAGAASGMVSTVLQIGAAVGAATLGGIFFSHLGTPPSPADYLGGFKAAVYVQASVLLLCMLLSLRLGSPRMRAKM